MNMSNMVGVGPFLTIPAILTAMDGPAAILGWILGTMIAVCDGMVWAELASAVPASGGTFEYLKAAYKDTPLGRLLPFLFIWQFILSGPLEVATGNIGIGQYLSYLVPLEPYQVMLVGVGAGVLAVALLYRRIESVGKLMVFLWAGVIVTLAVVLVPGLWHLNLRAALDFRPDTVEFSSTFAFGLGTATGLAMYNFLGYYSVCYIGDEVKDPWHTIPRSILISVTVIGVLYLALHVSIISVVPWEEAKDSKFVASKFMEQLFGRPAAVLLTILICWTAFASVFALLLGYSRIPYAAARDGYFFSAFARLHPRGDFPHVSLLVIGAVAVVASFLPLEDAISAMLVTRILVQFIAQIAAVLLLRQRGAAVPGFRMALYPLPSLVALAGWLFIFATSGGWYIAGGLGSLVLGVAVYFFWSRWFGGQDKGSR